MIYFMVLRWKGELSTENYLPWWFLVLANCLQGAVRGVGSIASDLYSPGGCPWCWVEPKTPWGSRNFCCPYCCICNWLLLVHAAWVWVVQDPYCALRRLVLCLCCPVFSCSCLCHLTLFRNSCSASSILQWAGFGLIMPAFSQPISITYNCNG